MDKVRVRYAPSPTGYLHIGNARTALFNYLFAKHYDGDFIVRIEDTDIERNIEGGEKSQLDNLKWLGIEWDESIDKDGGYGPYSQLERHKLGIYQKYADQMLDEGTAYRCFCTSEELDAEANRQKEEGKIPRYSGTCRNLSAEQIDAKLKQGLDYSIRIKVNQNEIFEWNDIVKGKVSFKSDDVTGDFNIIKSNTIPTYNFAVVIDDHLMAISHVLRGEDHISNTPKQMMVYQALNLEIPTFGHMTLIVNEEGKKLSKRDTSIVQFIEDYKTLGYLPEAMFNFITLLGWSPKGEEEIFTKEELIKIFDEKRLSKSAAKFDKEKLNFLNNQYIKALSEEDYLNFAHQFIDYDKDKYEEEYIKKIILVYKDQISYAQELNQLAEFFLATPTEINERELAFIQKPESKLILTTFKEKFEKIEDDYTSEDVQMLIKETQKETELKGKILFMSIRIGTTFQEHGPDLITSIELLGKEKILANLEHVIERIDV